MVEPYKPKTQEKQWLHYWEEQDIYQFNENSKQPIYSIDTPPPTVSGAMHIGHSFSYAQQDFIARYKRMQGFNVFYPFGTDDNGLPTERLVEKMKNIKGVNMPRDQFVKLCYDTIKEIKPGFIKPWKDLGISADFKHSYSTIDPHAQKTSQAAFIDLHAQGYVYQKEAPTIWCMECQTAIAQAELKDLEKQSIFNDIIFHAGGKEIIIATTRPDMLPACVAIIVNPHDERYKHLHGKHAQVPLYNYEVPILTDEKVSIDKGTGAVMCCTFGDKTDAEWWHQFNLPLRIIFNTNGTLNTLAGKYEGKTIKEARKAIIEDLKTAGLLKNQKQIYHTANVHERCDTPIEFLKTKQWFVRVLDNKEQFLEAGRTIQWNPDFMRKRYEHWVEGLQWDWCISRQRYFGIPFPIWYCTKCGTTQLADKKDLPIDPLFNQPKKKCSCGNTTFTPEKDVMDTWATSSTTPQIITNWVNKENTKLFPQDLRPQGQDIITTWAFYTIVKSLYLKKSIPWKNTMISGYVVDPHGEKMSKSKGNVIDPLQIMEKYSADILRYWAAGSKLGEDISYQEKEFIAGQKTITKLWNAATFALQHLEDYSGKEPKKLAAFDQWLLERLNQTITTCTESFEHFEYAKAKYDIDQFFWTTFCDYYLEIAKDRIYNKERTAEEKLSAQYTLHTALHTIIKLFAPFLPYITEELYHLRFAEEDNKKSIHLATWPTIQDYEKTSYAAGLTAIHIIEQARKYKAKHQLSMKTPITIIIAKANEPILKELLKDLAAVCVATIKFDENSKIVPNYEGYEIKH